MASRTIVDILRIYEQASLTPDKAALVYNGHAYSYAEFARWIDACRQYLAQQQLPFGSVAVLAAGTLLDEWVLGFALRSLGLNTVATRTADEARELDLRNIGCIVTVAAENPLTGEASSTDFPPRRIRVPANVRLRMSLGPVPEVPASKMGLGGHILLTSGTTGAYKKVLCTATAQALATPLHAEINGITSESVVYVANLGLWTAGGYRWPLSTWTKGGTVVIHQAPNLHQPLADRELTHIVLTPAMLAALLRAAGGNPRRNDATRLMVVAGAMPRAMLAAAQERLTRQVYSGLASTEGMTISSTPIERPEDLHWHRIHPSREVQVVDDAGKVLGPGREGLVRVRIIDGLQGYLDDEAATRKFFRDGWFYPGDLGLFGDDGRLTLRGRATDVVNVLGDKIATAPIERALQEGLGVEDACVVAIKRDDGDDEIHVVLQADRRIEPAEIEAIANVELRMMMRVPVHLSVTRELPRNEMGKIQRPMVRQQLVRSRKASPGNGSG
jgi:acyl-coenzyme A synthetase/AMP-(fatty) acid ligase